MDANLSKGWALMGRTTYANEHTGAVRTRGRRFLCVREGGRALPRSDIRSFFSLSL